MMKTGNPSLAQLHALTRAAAAEDATKHMVPTATARVLVDRGWATAQPGHRRGIWSITITDQGRAVVAASTPQQRDAAAADAYRPRQHGGRGHRFGGNR